MKIISWNARGLSSCNKRGAIKEILSKENPDLVVIQETKREYIDRKLVSRLWGSRFKDWSVWHRVGDLVES